MNIEAGQVVVMDYKVLDETGEVLEESNPAEPMVYLHGHRNILPALEAALGGKAEGELVSVTLPPEQAYGPRQEGAVDRVPIKHLVKPPKKIQSGSLVRVNTKEGARDAVVVKVGRFNVDLDSNHPYAGKTLTFDLQIQTVRAATAEELAHGHSHGIQGSASHHG
ncbi:MAG: FKBP-type peptidyl-prolyl cis-trans isomerase SlyD [Candidatus Azotimanducaceae bacterium]|jgi:FKBP-type peptidyl-prolyl cis-trans isomerase SlyD|tara:strand:+ start:2546 stop:3040 length:495 start_codon:yes stop_codon:yes gene_type:complete